MEPAPSVAEGDMLAAGARVAAGEAIGAVLGDEVTTGLGAGITSALPAHEVSTAKPTRETTESNQIFFKAIRLLAPIVRPLPPS